MRGQEHLGFWIGLVVLLSLLAIVIVVIAVGSLFGETQPIVKAVVTSLPVPTGVIVPTAVSTRTLATAIPPTASLGQCKNNATLVKHVTMPEATPWQPNQTFTKTWQIQNVGSCAWSSKYQLVHAQNERMATVGNIALPATILPGQSVDLTVAMTAPTTPGNHSGQWQLRDESGTPFGPLLPVSITVTVPPPTVCAPQIGSFTADRTAINRGESTTLRWGAITNGQRVEIDNGIGIVAAPSNRAVAPTQTTTFTLYATCGNNRVSKTLTITVTQPALPTSTPAPVSQRRKIDGIWSTDKYTFQLESNPNCTGADCLVQGEYVEWSDGPLVGGTVTGTFNVNTGVVALTIAGLPGGGKSFTGSVDANGTTLSGQLTGVGAIALPKK